MRYLVAALASFILGAASVPQETQDVDALIRKLGASDIAEREAATRDLLEKGQSIRPTLERATKHADAEIAARARTILETLNRHIDSLGYMLEGIHQEAGSSFHRLLHQGRRAVLTACQGRKWEDIAHSLRKQGMDLRHYEELRGDEIHRFLAKRRAYISPAGLAHDLFLVFETIKETSDTESTKTTIKEVKTMLRSSSKIEIADLREHPYADGTALGLLFERKELKEAADQWPVVQGVEIEYGDLPGYVTFEIDEPVVYYSMFGVRVDLADRERTAGTQALFSVLSGLNPLEGLEGEERLVRRPSRDTMGKVEGCVEDSWTRSSWTLRKIPDEKDPGTSSTPVAKTGGVAFGLGDLKVLPADLTELEIRGNHVIDEDCAILQRFARLRELRWKGQSNLSHGAIEGLAKLRTLERLELTDRPLDDDMRALTGLPRLKRLYILFSGLITDAGIAHLSALKDLASLELCWSKVLTDQSLERLAEMKNLEELDIWGPNRFSDKGLKALSTHGKLRTLRLSYLEDVSAEGLDCLKELKGLRELSIDTGTLTDRHMVAIAQCQGLEHISIGRLDQITDKGLLSLKSLPRLHGLRVFSCRKVTHGGMKALQSVLTEKLEMK